MKSYFLLIISCFFTSFLISQSTYRKELINTRIPDPDLPNNTYTKRFFPLSSVQTATGTIFLGHIKERQRFTELSNQLTLFKLNPNGDFAWSKMYPYENYLIDDIARGDQLSDIIQYDNRQIVGYLSKGRQKDETKEYSLLLSFDGEGNKIWDTQIEGRIRSNLNLRHNGNLRFTHWLVSVDGNTEIDENFLVEINKNGTVVELKQYTAPVFIQKFLTTKDGNTLFIAYDSNPNFSLPNSFTNTKSYIGKLDSEDQLIWMKSTEDVIPIDIEESSDGHIILSSSSSNDDFIHLSKLTSEGTEIWNRTVPILHFFTNDNIAVNSEDEIIVLNIGDSWFEDYSHVSSINQKGEMLWTRVLPRGWSSQIGHQLLNITEDNHIQFHGINRSTFFYSLNEKGQSEQSPLPSICVETQENSIVWKDTLISFLGTPNIELPWKQLAESAYQDTITQVIDHASDLEDRLTTYFEIPDTSCISSDVVPTYLPDNNFDQYDWTFESSNNPKFNEREPDAVTYANSGTFNVTLITNQDNCLDTFSREIVIIDKPALDLGEDLTLCTEESIELDVSSEKEQSYLWSDGTLSSTLAVNRSGQYKVTVTDAYCTAEDSIDITFIQELYPDFEISLGEDTTICLGDTYQLKVDNKDIDALVWNDGDNRLEKSINESGIYQVTAFLGDCPFEASISVDFKDCSSQVFVPNAFSPNEDGNNEEFFIEGKNITLVAVQIFDRWGSLIFDDINRPWDGKINGQIASKGTYIYQIVYIENLTGRRELITGTVSLIK